MPTVSAVDPGFDEIEYQETHLTVGTTIAPEAVLWVEVVGQLLADATIPDEVVARSKDTSEDSPAYIQRKARSYIFSTSEPTATDYVDICVLADLNPDLIRAITKRAISEGRRIKREVVSEMVYGRKPETD
jgi:hypothetical protein